MALNINGTTGISGVDASVSAPALTGTDSNTGISFPAADTIKFSTGGVERISITNSGISGTGIGASSGRIVQVVGPVYQTNTNVHSNSYYQELTDMSTTFNKTATSSKVIIIANITHHNYNDVDYRGSIALFHTTVSGNGAASEQLVQAQSGVSASGGSTSSYGYATSSLFYIDSGSSSSITYKIGTRSPQGALIRVFGGTDAYMYILELSQ